MPHGTSKCKCGQEILWGITPAGKNTPVNPGVKRWLVPKAAPGYDTEEEPTKFYWEQNRILYLVDSFSQRPKVWGDYEPVHAVVFEAHFSTCPYSEEFRRKERSKNAQLGMNFGGEEKEKSEKKEPTQPVLLHVPYPIFYDLRHFGHEDELPSEVIVRILSDFVKKKREEGILG